MEMKTVESMDESLRLPEAENLATNHDNKIVLDGQKVVKFEKPTVSYSSLQEGSNKDEEEPPSKESTSQDEVQDESIEMPSTAEGKDGIPGKESIPQGEPGIPLEQPSKIESKPSGIAQEHTDSPGHISHETTSGPQPSVIPEHPGPIHEIKGEPKPESPEMTSEQPMKEHHTNTSEEEQTE